MHMKKFLFATLRINSLPQGNLPPASKSCWRTMTLQAVSWRGTAWLPGKKLNGLTKLKQASLKLDFGSRQWEGDMELLAAGASKAVYALQDTNWVHKIAPSRRGTDLVQTLKESELARSDRTSKLVPHYFGGFFFTGDGHRSSWKLGRSSFAGGGHGTVVRTCPPTSRNVLGGSSEPALDSESLESLLSIFLGLLESRAGMVPSWLLPVGLQIPKHGSHTRRDLGNPRF